MKRTFLVSVSLLSALIVVSAVAPFSVARADDATPPADGGTPTVTDPAPTDPTPADPAPSTTPADPTPAPTPSPVIIHANVNVRYKGSLAWTGQVALTQGATASVADDTGALHSIPSDSALKALVAADALSPDFAVSDLKYYADYGAFFVKCMDIAAVPTHACDNWQYVVDSNYPPVGSDKYSVADGATIYFYYGNPRRTTLSAPTAEASSTVSVMTETYDYTNDTWKPLSGAEIGATQPNPNDPYSPLVLYRATSGSDGIAKLVIGTPGQYSVGLAADYYFPAEALTVTPKTTTQNSTTGQSSWSGGGTVVISSAVSATATSTALTALTASTTAVVAPAADTVVKSPESVMISLDMPLGDFIARYQTASASIAAIQKAAQESMSTQIASPEAAIDALVSKKATTTTATTQKKGWLGGLRNFLGI